MKFIFQTFCSCGALRRSLASFLCPTFHSPVNLDLLIVGRTIKAQQLFNNNKKRVVEDNGRESQYDVPYRSIFTISHLSV